MSLFDPQATQEDQLDESKKYFDELVGEGKKFKDNEALARGKYQSDLFVKTLEKRMDDLRTDALQWREQALASKNVQELLDQIKQQKLLASSETPPAKEEDQKTTTIDPKQIESLVSSKYNEIEMIRRQEANSNLVKSKLVERYGQGYQQVLERQMNELGMSPAFLDGLAKDNPNVLLRTLGLDQQPAREGFQAPPRNSNTFSPNPPKKRTWMYYQDLKKSNPKLYYDPKIAVQMTNDHAALGADFEDGDFHRFD